MRYKHFERADENVSAMGVGTWGIGGDGYGEVNDFDSIAGIRAMIDNGVNLVDTAPVYGNGHSEEIVGKAIAGYDRSKLLISTKFGVGRTTLKSRNGFVGPHLRDASYDNIIDECAQSLRRLNTDYVDFYFVHWPDPDTPAQETARALNQLKEEGKIRHIGVSNFNWQQIEELDRYCQIDVIQPPYSMLDRRDEELMIKCRQHGIDNLTYGSLGAGILTGKFRSVPQFGPGDPRNGFYPYFREPHFSKVMELLKVMDEIAAEHPSTTLAEIALNWTTQKDFVSTSLCGVKNARQGEQNCRAFLWHLTNEEMFRIDEAVKKYIDFDGEPNFG